MGTYSFLDTNAAIVGPGGTVNIGQGSAAAEEGITFAPNEDIAGMTVAADGEVMHSLYANSSGTATLRLLKTSPVNKQLMQMATLQRSISSSFGQNTISLSNNQIGDNITCRQCGFKRIPDLAYAKDGGTVEWVFNVGKLNPVLGGGG